MAQKYKTSIDGYNDRAAKAADGRVDRDKVKSDAGIELSEDKDKKTESSDSLEVAGAGISHIVREGDGTMVYMIQQGDTLTNISATLGYSVDELADFNQIRDVNLIYANSALRIPKKG